MKSETENTIEIGSQLMPGDWMLYDNGVGARLEVFSYTLEDETGITHVIRNNTILKVVPKKETLPRTVESVYREALEKLAKLGNGDRYGNSDGNKIAQEAIAWADIQLTPAPEFDPLTEEEAYQLRPGDTFVNDNHLWGVTGITIEARSQSFGTHAFLIDGTKMIPTETTARRLRSPQP
jgi:hypothetical protein